MSAHIVENSVIDYLLTFAKSTHGFTLYLPTASAPHNCKRIDGSSDASEIGQILLDENYRSVNRRYNETDKAARYTFRQHWHALEDRPHLRAVRIIKACNYFDYQACETDDYEQTPAASIINQIRKAAMYQLPGYEDAPWGAPEHQPERAAPISLFDMARAG